MTVIRHGRRTNFAKRPWLGDLVARKPTKVAAVALANKNAREPPGRCSPMTEAIVSRRRLKLKAGKATLLAG